MRLTPQIKEILPRVLELNGAGELPPNIAATLGVATPLIRKILGGLPKLVRQLEAEEA